MIPDLTRLLAQKQNYLNISYLLISFPLGLLYFILIIVGLAVGIATALVWIGVPILVLTMIGWWYLAAAERWMAIKMLGVHIAPMSVTVDVNLTLWQRIRMQFGNRMTWKSLAYHMVKFPFGVIAFALILPLLILELVLPIVFAVIALIVVPILYAIMAPIGARVPFRFEGRLAYSGLFAQLFYLVFTGSGLLAFPFYVAHGMAWMWGRFARSMLGLSDQQARLEEAEAQAMLERARAEKADQLRRELIINVSHELRTPVASIRGHLEALLNVYDEESTGSSGKTGGVKYAVGTGSTTHNYLTIVYREAIRLGVLVDELLSLARTETHGLSLNISAVEAGSIVEEVYQTLMPLARRERQITLVRAISPGLPLVFADRQRLIQVLLNLVRNAITYTPDGGIVSLSFEQNSPHYLTLAVADTGIGIAHEDQERIFERFYRTDASRTRSSGGFGLGLAIVRDLVHAMGGTINVESRVGEGSCFRVLLRISR